jgi:predicted DNA-binding transcriptional regulator AlpA
MRYGLSNGPNQFLGGLRMTDLSLPEAAPVAPGYLRQREACRYLGVSKCFLIALERAGNGPRKIRKGPRACFYRVVDLDAWMDESAIRRAA